MSKHKSEPGTVISSIEDNLLHAQSIEDPLEKARKEARKKAQELSLQFAYEGKLPKDGIFMELLKTKLPLFSGLLKSMTNVGSSSTSLAKVSGSLSNTSQAVGSGFQGANIVFSAVDVFRIPVIFFASYIAGEKPPIELSKAAKWGYSAALLALTITSVAIPPIAPIIAIAAAVVVLVGSIVTLGNLIVQRYRLKKALIATDKNITNAESMLEANRYAAELLHKELEQSRDLSAERLEEMKTELNQLANERPGIEKNIIELKDKQVLQQSELEQMGSTAFLDKGMGIGLASLGLLGAVLTLFFPPIGAGLVVASAAIGLLYLVGRLTAPILGPYLKSAFNSIKEKMTRGSDNDDNEPENRNLLDESQGEKIDANRGAMPSVHDSTADIMAGLYGDKKAGEALAEFVKSQDKMLKLDRALEHIITVNSIPENKNHAEQEMLVFIKHLAGAVDFTDCDKASFSVLSEKLANFKEAEPILQRALTHFKIDSVLLDSDDITLKAKTKHLVGLFKAQFGEEEQPLASDKGKEPASRPDIGLEDGPHENY